MIKLLVVTDIASTQNFFDENFKDVYDIKYSLSTEKAVLDYPNAFFDFLFVDLLNFKNFKNFPLDNIIFESHFDHLKKIFLGSKKIIMADRKFTLECIQSVKRGFNNYINYPLISYEIEHILEVEQALVKKQAVFKHFEAKAHELFPKFELKSKSKQMSRVLEQIKMAAPTKSTILILGESGTGKSALAKIVHDLSSRRKKKIISVHCGAIPDNLIESELFGHEKGAFTGAIKRKLGKFELAHEGTIFLDEIGTLSSSAQVSLLQVLQEKVFQRVGGEHDVSVDVRVIAATNIDLKLSVKEQRFREDLFFRLNVFPIEIPPLRNRTEDILDIAYGILNRLNISYGKDIKKIDEKVECAFLSYAWPGNIRELENMLERAYVIEKSYTLASDNFPLAIFQNINSSKSFMSLSTTFNLSEARKKVLDDFERNFIQELLIESKGDIKTASCLAGVSVRQIHKIISKHHVNRKQFENQNSIPKN